MAIDVPTPGDIQRAFEDTFREILGQIPEPTQEDIDRSLRRTDLDWGEIYSGVQCLPENQGVTPLRIQHVFTVVHHRGGQREEAARQIRAMAQAVRGLVTSGARVELRFDLRPPRQVAFGEEVDSRAEGMIRR